ncbi:MULTISPECIES: hypothetical protein [Bradyrhizobium]|uniref:hypothetical protein n=1 Tax=Bradyrhizobium TaxID=374 RepID=UPI001CD7C101|nr:MULTISPECIES: hypothetical protein [Bradyrhizobium]
MLVYAKPLLKEGRLSSAIIDSTVGLPCASTYHKHFGSMMNVYRLIGYTPKRNYAFLQSRPRWAEQEAKLGSHVAMAIRKAGGRITSSNRTDYLRVRGSVNISIRSALCCGSQNRALYWSIKRRARLPQGWIAAIRLSEHNESVLDYVLLPTDGKVKGTTSFTERARVRRGIARFETPDALVRAIAKLVKRRDRSEPAPHDKRSRPKQLNTKNARARH